MKKLHKSLLIMMLGVVLMMSACSSNNSGDANTNGNNGSAANQENNGGISNKPKEEEKSEELPPVEISWHLATSELQPDIASVEKAVNEYIQPKINATLKFYPTVAGSYEDKMNTLFSAGEEMDLVWTSSWQFRYGQNAEKGAFLDIGDLVQEYAPNFYASLPDFVWEDAKHLGTLYAVPNYQISAKLEGLVVQKELAEKYDLDVESIKTLQDIEPFLKTIKENEPDKIPFSASNTFRYPMHGFDGIAGTIYEKGDPTYTVVDEVFTDAYMNHHIMLHDWYNKGYINKDVATANLAEVVATGKVAVKYDVTLKPGGEAEEMLRNGGHEVVYIPMTESTFSGVQSTMTAIAKTSKHPERAMMLLELINTDPKLFNLLAFGIESKHYEKVGDNKIKVNPDGGYAPNHNWRIGNVTNGYLQDGQQDDTWEKTIEMNESAVVPEIYGFKFDNANVKTQDANVQAAAKEFSTAILTGAVDPTEYVPKLRDALTKAGIEDIRLEKQKQLDAFLKEKGLK